MNKVTLLLIFVIVVVVLAIPYSIETWLATVVIAGIFRGDGVSFKGK